MFDYLNFKKFQYGYHGKNGKVSDQTERTYWEYYSNIFANFRKNMVSKLYDFLASDRDPFCSVGL